jgi:hypothetical protein
MRLKTCSESGAYRATDAIAAGLRESTRAEAWPIQPFILQEEPGEKLPPARSFPLYFLLMGKRGLKLTKKKLTRLFLTVPPFPLKAEKNMVLSLRSCRYHIERVERRVGPYSRGC